MCMGATIFDHDCICINIWDRSANSATIYVRLATIFVSRKVFYRVKGSHERQDEIKNFSVAAYSTVNYNALQLTLK